MYFTINDIYKYGHNMYDIRNRLNDIHNNFRDYAVLGNFPDNHDNPRFLNNIPDLNKFKNVLVFNLFC